MSRCVICGRKAGVDATLHHLDEAVPLPTVFDKAVVMTIEAGLCVACPQCEAWLPNSEGAMPGHIDFGPMLAAANLHEETASQLRLELEGHVRRLAAALTGDGT